MSKTVTFKFEELDVDLVSTEEFMDYFCAPVADTDDPLKWNVTQSALSRISNISNTDEEDIAPEL